MRRRAFTLTEILLAMIVVSIVGAALVAALFAFLNSYNQTEDYATAREGIENTFQVLSPQFNNAGLGMPNNRRGDGSFHSAFAPDGNRPKLSVMSLMGAKNKAWGGPITVASGALSDAANHITVADVDGNYSGSELYFAWSEPTGILVSSDLGSANMRGTQGYKLYQNYQLLSTDIGYWTGDKLILRWGGSTAVGLGKEDWIVFPSFGAPLWVEDASANGAVVLVAPGAEKERVLLGGVIHGFEEVHRVRTARLRMISGDLVQEFYETPPQSDPSRTEILMRNVAGVWFRFNPQTRILNLSIAARGINSDPKYAAGARPTGWPDGAPDVGDGRHRILVENMTWRIRN